MVKTSATVSIKNYLRAVAEKNREIVASIYQQTLDEDLTVSQAKQKAADILLSQTIGNSGYIYCVNSVGTVLSPVKFLNRSAEVFPDKLAVIYGEQRYTYAQFQKRVFRLASALKKNNIGKGDKVAFICPNTPPMLEAHFAVPMIGAALVSVNIRLAAPEIAYIVDHSDAKALFVDNEFGTIVASIQSDLPKVKTYVNICDVDDTTPLDGPNYETFIATGSEAPVDIDITDEKDIMTINYTSGTTGKPKGVMYHHRGAYINALGELLEFNIRPESLYLWSFIFRDKKHLP
ncbi:MAG: AMP-binding protein [Desulfobacula sp.]|nr:AMP-binding protein [Desulfobacula sp.]